MVHEDDNCSNSSEPPNFDAVFQTLHDWEHQLRHADINFEELGL